MRGWRRGGGNPPAAREAEATRPAPGWPLRTLHGRFDLTPERQRLVWFLIGVFSILPSYTAINHWNDFPLFWAGGATVGGPNLADAARHGIWQVDHGMLADAWRYPPAFAYLYWPLAQLPMGVGFAINTVVMIAMLVLCSWFLTRIFGFSGPFGRWLTIAWTPSIAAIAMGQNAPFAFVLALWAIDALRRERPVEVGLAVGLMLYKPTLGLPLLGLLLLRGQWRALLVAGGVAAIGYLVSVVGAGGDWLWPIPWWNGIWTGAGLDRVINGDKSVSIPSLLLRVDGTPGWLAYGAGGIIVLASLRGLVRAPIVEAAAAACLVAIVAGPRVWGYETGLLLPLLGWTAACVPEPWRTRLVLLATVPSVLWMLTPATRLSAVAVIVVIAMLLWLRRWPPLVLPGLRPAPQAA